MREKRRYLQFSTRTGIDVRLFQFRVPGKSGCQNILQPNGFPSQFSQWSCSFASLLGDNRAVLADNMAIRKCREEIEISHECRKSPICRPCKCGNERRLAPLKNIRKV